MRVLLDEQLPRQLAPHLTGHAVRTVQQERWAGLTNGALLRQAEAAGFDLFVTADENLEFQLRTVRLRIVLLERPAMRLKTSFRWFHRCWSRWRAFNLGR